MKFEGIDAVTGLNVTGVTNSTISLKWNEVKDVTGYNVTPEVRLPYPQSESVVTKTNSITLKGLSPGIVYTIKVKAFKKTFTGQEGVISVSTMGRKLSEVRDLIVQLIKWSGTSVKLTWEPPQDPRKVQWEYGIYYALNSQDLFKSMY